MQTLEAIIVALLTALGAAVAGLIRMIFTNEKKIQLLEADIEHRTRLLTEVREEQREMRRDIQRLFERGIR